MGLFDFLKKKKQNQMPQNYQVQSSVLPPDRVTPPWKPYNGKSDCTSTELPADHTKNMSSKQIQPNIRKSSVINSQENADLPYSVKLDDYQDMRDFEERWIEKHYDVNSLEGINAIPVSKDLPRPPTSGITGEIYYYLRHKAYDHEEAGNYDLAIACLRKSNQLLAISQYAGTDKECYALVKMLARAGQIEEAYAEKARLDAQRDNFLSDLTKKSAKKELESAALLNTDLIIMDAHASTCPECAKYQGRVYSISGKNRLFPKVPDFFFTTGSVHDGCSHNFAAYIHGVSDPMLEYTLQVHPLRDMRYGANIVAFSNRPFEDDRTEACIAEASATLEKAKSEQAAERFYYENMVEIEAERGRESRDFQWLQENFPEMSPKSVSGFRRMKHQNTKNYQLLKQLAAEKGRDI